MAEVLAAVGMASLHLALGGAPAHAALALGNSTIQDLTRNDILIQSGLERQS